MQMRPKAEMSLKTIDDIVAVAHQVFKQFSNFCLTDDSDESFKIQHLEAIDSFDKSFK